MLLHTATEEIGHIEMLATAVALNLDKAPTSLEEEGAADGVVGAIMGGGSGKGAIEHMIHKNLLSAGLAAMPMDSDGVPFNMSRIYASGNVAADMYCNVAAESTGRVLAVRLFNATEDAGMKKMLHYMIARDTMHQQQWLAVLEELGGPGANLPIPNSFPQEQEDQQNNYNFYATAVNGSVPAGRWSSGPSIDGKGASTVFRNEPLGDTPVLGAARPDSAAQSQQIG